MNAALDITKLSPEEMDAAFQKLPLDELERYIRIGKRKMFALESRDDFVKFQRYIRPNPNDDDPEASRYEVKPHIRLLCETVMRVEKGEKLRVALSLPPQVGGKSEVISRGFPAWFIGRNPAKHIMQGTYNQDFADDFGEDVRSILQSREFRQVFPRLELRSGSKAKDHMVTKEGGKLSFMGRGGSATGRAADLFIIDDPYKDAADAGSLANREVVWQWFTRVVNTRMRVTGACIIVMTRWTEDDLIGRLLDPSSQFYNKDVAKHWTYINIPEIVDDPHLAEALGMKVNDVLWPERRTREMLDVARLMDPQGFSALHMGRPTPPEGTFFKQHHLHTYEQREMPKNLRYYETGDLAVSTDRKANKSCVGVWGLDEADCLWCMPDLYWDRKSSDESVERIIDLGHNTYPVFQAFFEKGQLDKAIGPFLDKRMLERKAGFAIERLPVTANKGVRAVSIRGRMAQGKVRFPAFAPWWPAAKEQMLKFTGSGDDAEDDFVDFCSLIGQALGMQLKASGESAKVVAMPKVGTFAWTKFAADRERRAAKSASAGW